MPLDDLEPHPEITPDTKLRLSVAAARAVEGGLTVNVLRREGQRGRLKIYRIGNKDYTTLRDIADMMEACVVPVLDSEVSSPLLPTQPQEGSPPTRTRSRRPGMIAFASTRRTR